MLNIDAAEVNKFTNLAAQWWDADGPCAPLHTLNPARFQFVCQHANLKFAHVLDVGCGAGILSESLATVGAKVVGIDASRELIQAAREHAQEKKLAINYEASSIEEFSLENPEKFDVITCMELIEHVPDPAKLIQDCAQLLKPGGQIFISTLNRTPKAYALAIVGAEYIFNILPKLTHDYKKFIRPAELATMFKQTQIQLQDLTGIKYQPFSKFATFSEDVNVNYIAYGRKDH